MNPLIAATATAVDEPGLPWGWLVLGLVLAGVAYAGSCLFWPWARCLWCEGAGRRSRRDGRVWRTCRVCKGSGRRLRVGRRIYNAAAGRARDAG
ncbi:hypothetical protein AB0I61_17495 [Polymorphospora rubra]|uniref:hypothetical protein n=1 Tax=Polymorphospora rubra TaxID=338584 RepID=UPI0033DFB147